MITTPWDSHDNHSRWKNNLFRFIFYWGIIFMISCGVEKPAHIVEIADSLPEKIDYNFHVKPILADRCFACHGPDQKSLQAGLRLDIESSAYGELPESPGKKAITPGNLGKSQIYHRLITDDPELVMPPPESNLELSDREKAILFKWIEQGAIYQPHWAFMPVKKFDTEEATIDYFISKKLKEQNLSFSEKANKEILVRRLYFDITGLPPSLEAIDAFLADTSAQAYENIVDQLLASPEYGERMAAYWMDVARYTDSDGYLDDKHRDFSPWRDWVIQAFNQNLPYNSFVTWQLAGDLLPNPYQEQILATAFNRLHKKNSEAGIVFEEYRVEYVADRTNTFGKAFLGLSLECARCHDHKYDPISQKDYYEYFAFFNSTDEIGHAVYGPDQTPGPALLLTTPDVDERRKFLEKKYKEAEKEVKQQAVVTQVKNDIQYAITEKTLSQNLQKHLVSHLSFDQIQHKKGGNTTTPDLAQKNKYGILKSPEIKPGITGNAFFVTDYNHGKFPEKVGWFERTDPFSMSLWVLPDTIYQKVNIFTHCEELRLGLKGYSLHLENNKPQFIISHSWPQNALQVTSTHALPQDQWSMITLTYDGSSKAEGIEIFINGTQEEVTIDRDHLYKGILFEWNIHTYGFNGLEFGSRNKMVPFKGGGIDEFMVFDRQLTALEVQFLHNENQVIQSITAPSPQTKDLLQDYSKSYFNQTYIAAKDSLRAIREEINDLYNQIPEIMVMGDLPQPRPTYILERGNYATPGEEVFPDVAESVFPFPESLPRNRLGLAQWLFHPEHPLTARVMVNRIWQMYFGQGLVKTSEDFGSQGELPTHLELLDFLASNFIESGWDLKLLQKRIVMSETYQQSSVITPELLEVDPENRYLARGPSFRLPAEMIRDNALAVSGLLVKKTGGESVYPYQPEGLWDEITNKHWRYRYLQTPGEGLYRRSLYTIWKRTSPPPSMQIFDIADRDNCTVRRLTTSTPLQALVLLNDPQYQEAARVLGEKVIGQFPGQPDLQIQAAFRLITGRYPDSYEATRLHQFYEKQFLWYKEHLNDAEAYLSVGEYPVNQELPNYQLAAIGITINSMMNTVEAFTRK